MRFSTTFMGLCLSVMLMNNAPAANDVQVGQLNVSQAWVRASVPGQTNGAGYVTITNKSDKDDKLVAVSSARSAKAEIHEVITEGGNAKMREVAGVVVPAHGSVTFAPGGYHLMFLQLSSGFAVDTSVPVTLKFEQAGAAEVTFDVKPATYNPAGGAEQHMHGDHDHMSGMKH